MTQSSSPALVLLPWLSATVVTVLPGFSPPLLELVAAIDEADDDEVYDAPLLIPEDVEDVEEEEEWVCLSTTIATG